MRRVTKILTVYPFILNLICAVWGLALIPGLCSGVFTDAGLRSFLHELLRHRSAYTRAQLGCTGCSRQGSHRSVPRAAGDMNVASPAARSACTASGSSDQ